MDKSNLTHVDAAGRASMVDVSAKPPMKREATACGVIQMQESTIELIRSNSITKGDVLTVARLAGIQAAKQTAALIPLCHTLPLSHVQVDLDLHSNHILISASASTIAGTGVEMEALTAVSVAALTIYDMTKAVDKTMSIEGIHLQSKTKVAI